jgi:hypothetical protein
VRRPRAGASATRRPRAALALAAALATALTGAVLAAAPGAALAAAPNPPADLPLGPLPAECESAPTGARCERASIAALDGARAKLGLGPYRLPAGFVALSPPRQWLILANLDRIAYSLPPIRGLAVALDAVAAAGAREHGDPDPWPLLQSLSGQLTLGFTSNWAGGQQNALLAYYGWLYDDGYGSGNLDCTSPSAAGCWGHRQDVLAFPSASATLTMGASAIVRGERSYALTIVETTTPVWRYSYTWARARSSGAGR